MTSSRAAERVAKKLVQPVADIDRGMRLEGEYQAAKPKDHGRHWIFRRVNLHLAKRV